MSKMRAICAVRIGIGIGATADHVGALLAGLHQQLLGAGIVGEALLRERADLQVDCPRIIAFEPAHRVETVEPHARVDFDVGAHAGRAMDDGLLQRVRARA